MKPTLLFDFDGTIADSITPLVTIFNELAEKHHLPRKIKKEDISLLRQLHLQQVLQAFHIPVLQIPSLLYEGRKKFAQKIASLKPIEGIKDSLAKLKKEGATLGIVTSNSEQNVKTFLKANNIDSFDFIHSEKGLFGKDRVLIHVISHYKLSKKQTLYIGDELRDIDAARKAGIAIVSVTWGANAKEALAKEHPDYIIDRPSQLEQLITHTSDL